MDLETRVRNPLFPVLHEESNWLKTIGSIQIGIAVEQGLEFFLQSAKMMDRGLALNLYGNYLDLLHSLNPDSQVVIRDLYSHFDRPEVAMYLAGAVLTSFAIGNSVSALGDHLHALKKKDGHPSLGKFVKMITSPHAVWLASLGGMHAYMLGNTLQGLPVQFRDPLEAQMMAYGALPSVATIAAYHIHNLFWKRSAGKDKAKKESSELGEKRVYDRTGSGADVPLNIGYYLLWTVHRKLFNAEQKLMDNYFGATPKLEQQLLDDYHQSPYFPASLLLADLSAHKIYKGETSSEQRVKHMAWLMNALKDVSYEAENYASLPQKDRERFQRAIRVDYWIRDRYEELGRKKDSQWKYHFIQHSLLYDLIKSDDTSAVEHAKELLETSEALARGSHNEISKQMEQRKAQIDEKDASGEEKYQELKALDREEKQLLMDAYNKNVLMYAFTADAMHIIAKAEVSSREEASALEKLALGRLWDLWPEDNRVRTERLAESKNRVFVLEFMQIPETEGILSGSYVFKQTDLAVPENERKVALEKEVTFTEEVKRIAWSMKPTKGNPYAHLVSEKELIKIYDTAELTLIKGDSEDPVLASRRSKGRTLLTIIEQESEKADYYMAEAMRFQAAVHAQASTKGILERDYVAYVKRRLGTIPGMTQSLVSRIIDNYSPVVNALTDSTLTKVRITDGHPENMLISDQAEMIMLDCEGSKIGIPQIDLAKKLNYGRFRKEGESIEEAEMRKQTHLSMYLEEYKRKTHKSMDYEKFLVGYYNAVIDLAFAYFGSKSTTFPKEQVRDEFMEQAFVAIKQLQKLPGEYYRTHETQYLALEACLKELQAVQKASI